VSLKKFRDDVSMVFTVDNFNRATYQSYTRDNTLGYFIINGKEMGKQVFTKLTLEGKDLEEFKASLPVDTEFNYLPNSVDSYEAVINYHINPKSVFGVILKDYKAEIAKSEREKAHLGEVAVNFRDKYFEAVEEYREDKSREGRAYKRLEDEKKVLEYNYNNIKDARKSEAESCDKIIEKQFKKARMLHLKYATLIGLILLFNICTFMSI
jgi:hypothetical protein